MFEFWGILELNDCKDEEEISKGERWKVVSDKEIILGNCNIREVK